MAIGSNLAYYNAMQPTTASFKGLNDLLQTALVKMRGTYIKTVCNSARYTVLIQCVKSILVVFFFNKSLTIINAVVC